MKHIRFVLAALGLLAAGPLAAAEHTVSQKGKAFTTSEIKIKVGDKVAFRNDDPFVHNVFSLTDPISFDLGTYGAGASKSQLFDKEGKFEIECAIHPEMKMLVVVSK